MPSHPVFGDDPDLADALESLADAMPVHAMILDADRRIVFANQRLRALLGDERFETIAKLRPGEALRCVHSLENPGGCGCSDHCGVCGAFMAIRAAMQGRRAVQECRMKTADGSSHDFRVWANPVVLGGRKLTAFSILDISDEKRREKLEHTFFHDMMNMASGIYGMMEVIDMSRDDSEECTRHLELAKKCALHLTGEIRAAMALSRAELNSLNTTPNSFMVSALVDSVAEFFRIHSTTGAIRLDVTLEGGDLEIVSDESLLVRVLVNLVMNAVEASDTGARIRLAAETSASDVLFEIHNDTPIDEFVRKQVFERSFTTKGRGHGTGTYSAKLFTEKYLGGKIWFASSPEAGTSFFVKIPSFINARPRCEAEADRAESASQSPIREPDFSGVPLHCR